MAECMLTLDPILPDRVLDGLPAPEDGALLLFLGIVRNHNQGREVSGLEYQAYEEMANKVLAEIGAEAETRFGTGRIRILHRVGRLEVGQVGAAIAVATSHRAEAYEASRFIIEEIKLRLPVWKKEAYRQGGTAWVPGHVPSPSPSRPAGKRDGVEEIVGADPSAEAGGR